MRAISNRSAEQSQNLAAEISKLSQRHAIALKDAAFLGMTREQANDFDQRRDCISELSTTVGKLKASDLVFKAYENTFQSIQRTCFSFLMADLRLAMTRAHIAYTTYENFEKRSRNQQNARRTYDTVLRLSRQISLTQTGQKELGGKLGQLKYVLEGLGEVF